MFPLQLKYIYIYIYDNIYRKLDDYLKCDTLMQLILGTDTRKIGTIKEQG